MYITDEVAYRLLEQFGDEYNTENNRQTLFAIDVDNAKIFNDCLWALFNADLLDRYTINTLCIVKPEYLKGLSLGLHAMQQAGILDHSNFRTLIDYAEHAKELGVGLSILQKPKNLFQRTFEALIANAKDAIEFAVKLIVGQHHKPVQTPLKNSFQAIKSAEDIINLAANPMEFYALPARRPKPEDNTKKPKEHMVYVYEFLEKNNYIPKQRTDIINSINKLVTYANSFNESDFQGSLPEDAKRMFKFGVDRLLRHNERLATNENWSGRALLLGLNNYIEKYQINNPGDKAGLLRLQQALILGVGQVIEAEAGDGNCKDPICLTAAARGFFANNSPNNEMKNLTGVYPHCSKRLENISVEFAAILNYKSSSVSHGLLKLLKTMPDETRSQLIAKVTTAAETFAPEDMQITNQDSALAGVGITSNLLANLVQIYANEGSDALPDGFSADDTAQIKSFLEPARSKGISHK